MRSVLEGARVVGHGFRALGNRNYRLFWSGQLVSLAGTWMQDTALALLVLHLTNSPLALGLTMTFRYLLGEVSEVFAQLRRLNPAIRGEETGQVFLRFRNGATATWDANR